MADKYANVLFQEVTESAANTLTFEAIDLGLSLFDKVGLLVSRIEWYNWEVRLLAAADVVNFGLSSSNQFATVTAQENSIVTYHYYKVLDYGVAGNNKIFTSPLVDDFSTLPGGGLLVTPRPLYIFAQGANLAGTITATMRMFFTVVTLKPEEYFELLETRQFFG